ncbi:galactoside 2-alpha-L-fucosyltransferase-like [Punica granatum]|uniref:Fucosyltransferase n=1 Tax=Punica granatum TaxID=22663 RepID=A0A6P8EB15_PUNGR|nr:galactoside 2-alpha-L-fucosyltransferase-like [Punica granatum]
MKRREKNQSGGEEVTMKLSDGNGLISSRDPERKNGVNTMRVMGAFVACLMVSSVFFSLSVVLRDLPSDGVPSEERVLEVDVKSQKEIASGEGTSRSVEEPKDKLLGGLLTAGFDEQSCISRYGSVSYRKGSEHRPSTYLVSRLRSYEALHKQCGPNTESYNRAMDYLRLGNASAPPPSDCKYIVWVSFSGLGNRILTLASTFLYALLTNRILLVDPGANMTDLFCEPFPEASWFLPPDFPLKDQFNGFGQSSPRCYGKMLKENSPNLANKLKPPSYLYLHLVHDYDDQDKLFFCEDDQSFLKEVPWLVMKTDNYFIPSLFLIPTFEEELNNLFPRKEMVFHFLGRYLFHPTDTVWGLIERYYRAYLSGFDKKIGIQIRVFDTGTGPFQHVLDQILACATREHLLPGVDKDKSISPNSDTQKSKAVLITSLSPGYLEQIRDLYWENPTITGEVVSVFQPSHEEYQQTEKQMHNQKAWAEMYLLSLTDVLITSSWSTFGYVAQGLGGLRPWILYKPENRTVPDPPCRRAMSMEPCFHAPPFYDCRAKRGIDTGELVPHVRHCEDMSWGLKLVDPSTD